MHIDKHEITQASFELVMGCDPASGSGDGDDYPVYNDGLAKILDFGLAKQPGSSI